MREVKEVCSLNLLWEALGAMGGVGAVGVTWAWLLPPTRPRGVLENQGDTPGTPVRGGLPSAQGGRAL